jgi:hypothetical protein
MSIEINKSGDGLKYWYNSDIENAVEVEIEYIEDRKDVLGYGNTDELYPAFTTEFQEVYFIGEFMRDNW